MTQPQPDPSAPFRHALIDVHSNYRGQRLTHEPPDELVSDIVTTRILRPHLLRSGFFLMLFLAVNVLSFVIFFFALIAAASSAVNSSSYRYESSADDSASGLVGLAYLLGLLQILVVVAWIVSLFFPIREPIAEYGLLIEGRGSASAVSYAWIVNTIRVRQSPFRTDFAKVRGFPLLLLANGREEGFVIVRPVGNDLYLGWSMWRSRSTIVLIGHIFRDMFSGFGGKGLDGEVRAAATRALRELIHSVTREGVQAAILQPPVPEEAARAQVDQLRNLDSPTGYVPPQPVYYAQPGQPQPGQPQPSQTGQFPAYQPPQA
jgi:hypothetical protein